MTDQEAARVAVVIGYLEDSLKAATTAAAVTWEHSCNGACASHLLRAIARAYTALDALREMYTEREVSHAHSAQEAGSVCERQE